MELEEEEKVLIILSKKDCAYLKDDVEAHIQDIEEELVEISDDPVLILLYPINLGYWKRILPSLKKALEAEP